MLNYQVPLIVTILYYTAVKIVPVIDWIDNFSSILSGVPMKMLSGAGYDTSAVGCLCLM